LFTDDVLFGTLHPMNVHQRESTYYILALAGS
jgi:hypothetical protein